MLRVYKMIILVYILGMSVFWLIVGMILGGYLQLASVGISPFIFYVYYLFENDIMPWLDKRRCDAESSNRDRPAYVTLFAGVVCACGFVHHGGSRNGRAVFHGEVRQSEHALDIVP